MDWLADSRKKTKPKTSNNKMNKQGFRASLTNSKTLIIANNLIL